ncbi:MAG TPA: hypothetical protein DCY93_03535, partial [Firmicutes bacterium]|nr:hypothetical protein [Bacillota bacterium]
YTSRGLRGLSPWADPRYSDIELILLIKGNNPLSKIEIVSALNSFNITYQLYIFDCYYTIINKYNPKVYLGAVQSVANTWNFDRQNVEKWTHGGLEKSGS